VLDGKRASHAATQPRIDVAAKAVNAKAKRASRAGNANASGNANGSDQGSSFEACLTLTAARRKAPESEAMETLVVLFGRDYILGVGAVNELTQYLQQHPVSSVIVVTKQSFTAWARGPLSKLCEHYSIRTFLHEQLLVDKTKHVLVKPHLKLDDQDRQRLLRTFKVEENPEQLPKIFRSEPMALHFNLQAGEIVKIVNVGAPPNYRLVVNRPI
jgi:DNA-directed RNA polymerase subunit H (RpoH/RPB5)